MEHAARCAHEGCESWLSVMPMVRGIVGRRVPSGDVDDVVHDTMVELLRGATDVHKRVSFAAAVAKNCCARYHRASAHRAMIEAPDMDVYAAETRFSIDVRAWLQDKLLPALSARSPGARGSSVTPRMMQVLRQLAEGSTSIKQLASQLGTQPHRIRETLRKAAEKIRTLDVPPITLQKVEVAPLRP